jgi:hypothetical protein
VALHNDQSNTMMLAELRHGHSLTVAVQKQELILLTLLSRDVSASGLATKFG